MRWLVDKAYSAVPVVRLVLDNLNTHRTASLYETFPAVEARRISKGLEFHYTPKHGSWFNMAESSSACCPAPASASGSQTRKLSRGRSRPWPGSATPPKPPSTGGSIPKMPEPNFIAFPLLIPKLTDY